MAAAEQRPTPDWDRLYDTAAAQGGHFTTAQAGAAGFSPQLLNHRLRKGLIIRVRRGVYRLVHFPPGDHEDLVVIWLWSEQRGVFGHDTALALHGLSDALPASIHMTLPLGWRRRRLRTPTGVIVHYGDVPTEDRAWFEAVPATSASRTLVDCVEAHVPPDLVLQAAEQGRARGILSPEAIRAATGYLASFDRGDGRG